MLARLLDDLMAQGRSCFSFEELLQISSSSAPALKAALYRLHKRAVIAMPHRGFYAIVPPEHRSKGCLPPQEFIPDLMAHLGEVYYAGLLTAAEYHGAAHHRPQMFQVVVAKVRRPILCGVIRVQFMYRKNAALIPTEPRNTPSGTLQISTAEATALDLVGYAEQCAGLNNVATILAELGEILKVDRLFNIAALSPTSWLQRLGYLLNIVGELEKADLIAGYIQEKNAAPTPLAPKASIQGSKLDRRWQVFVNTDVESDL